MGISTALPLGFNVGASTQVRWTDYQGQLVVLSRATDQLTLRIRIRSPSLSLLKRDFTLFGFQPADGGNPFEERDSNAQLHDYDRAYVRTAHDTPVLSRESCAAGPNARANLPSLITGVEPDG